MSEKNVNKQNKEAFIKQIETVKDVISWQTDTSTVSPKAAFKSITAWLLFVYTSRTSISSVNASPAMLMTLLSQRKVHASIPSDWATTTAQSPITDVALLDTPEKVVAFIKALGMSDVFKESMPPGVARYLFPTPASRAASIEAVLDSYAPLRAIPDLTVALALFWGIEAAMIAPLVYHAITQPSFVASLAKQAALEPAAVLRTHVGPFKAAHAAIGSATAVTGEQLAAWHKALPQLDRAIQQEAYEISILAPVPAPAVTVAAAFPTAHTPSTSSSLDARMEALEVKIGALVTTQNRPPRGGGGGGGAHGQHRGGGGARRRGGGAGGNNASAKSRNEKGEIICYNCQGTNHIAADCKARKSGLNGVDQSLYEGLLFSTAPQRQLNVTEWGPAWRLEDIAVIRATPTASTFTVEATVDSGAPYSVISPETATRLGCVVRAYSGPEMKSLSSHPMRLIGETSLEHVVLSCGWTGPMGLIAVAPSPWPLLIGLRDIVRAGPLMEQALARLRANTQKGGAGPRGGVAGLVYGEGERELRAASDIARRVGAQVHAADQAAAASAQPIPPSWSAAESHTIEPAIRFDDPAEVQLRRRFKLANRDAYKEILVDERFPLLAEAKALAKEYADVFASKNVERKPPVIDTSQPGAYPLQLRLIAGVQVGTAAQPPFESRREKERLRQEYETLIRDGRAVPAVSPLAINDAFVAEKGRVVYNATATNNIAYGTAHTLPSTDAQVADLAAFDGEYSLEGDLIDGFNQWVLAKGSGVAACVRINGHTLEPKCPSMGISSVPAEFHALVSRIFEIKADDIAREPLLADVKLKTFIDDFGGKARSAVAALALFGHLVRRARQYGFHFNAAKMRFGFPMLTFCGTGVLRTEIVPLESYAETIRAMARPETREEMVRELGMCTWLMPHLSDVFADIAEMRSLLKQCGSGKSAPLTWTPEAERAFQRVRTCMADVKTLVAFDPTKTLYALTDASSRSAACCFMQLHRVNGRWTLRLVYALCKNFTGAEMRYTTAEQELAALRDAHARMPQMMLGRTVVWLTDNTAVAELLQGAKITKKRRLRTTWLDLIGIRIVAVHIAGKLNVLADALSRNPALARLAATTMDESETVELRFLPLELGADAVAGVPAGGVAVPAPPAERVIRDEAPTADTLRRRATQAAAERAHRLSPDLTTQAAELLESDASLSAARTAATTGAALGAFRFEMAPVGDRSLLFATRVPRGGDLAHPEQRRRLMVVPRGLRQPVLEALHALSAHGPASRLLHVAERSFWWPTLARDARALVAACDACARAKRITLAGNFGDAEQEPDRRPTAPGQVYELDTWVSGQSLAQELVISGAQDQYDGFVTLLRQPANNSAGAARLLRLLHDTHGTMRLCQTDGGPEWSGDFDDLCKRLRVHHSRGTPGNSNAQAGIERVFEVLNMLLTRFITHNAGGRLDPDDLVSAAVTAINSLVSPAVAGAPASSAYQRRFGRPAPLSPLLASMTVPDAAADSPLARDIAQFVCALANGALLDADSTDADGKPLSADERAARRSARVTQTQQSVAEQFGPPLEVVPGDLVFLNNPKPVLGKIRKIVGNRLGPFRVIEITRRTAAGAPLRVRLQSLLAVDDMRDIDVLVRELTKCGPTLQIDDPMLRELPPSGYFVGELVDDASESAVARLQAITEQSLAPEVRTRLRARRAAALRRAPPLSVATDEEAPLDAEAEPVVSLFDDEDDDSDNEDAGAGPQGAADDAGGEAKGPPRADSPVQDEPEKALPLDNRPVRVRKPPTWLDPYQRSK